MYLERIDEMERKSRKGREGIKSNNKSVAKGQLTLENIEN